MSKPGGEMQVCGVIMVDKPAKKTSHDVVSRIRRASGLKKIGHGGTLDPFATGLLLVLTGKATRLFDYLAPLSKTYRVTMQLGAVSTTGDVDGQIKKTGGIVKREELESILPRFRGMIKQRVPVFSAVKVGGVPLHRQARRGGKVEPPVRDVEIYQLELESFDPEFQRAVLKIKCSKGTYIRSLCEDLGSAAGSGAYALELRRLAIGNFSVENSASLEKLEAMTPKELLADSNPAFISCLSALYFLPVRELDPLEAEAVAHGRPLTGVEQGPVRLSSGGRLLAVYGPGDSEELIYPRLILV